MINHFACVLRLRERSFAGHAIVTYTTPDAVVRAAEHAKVRRCNGSATAVPAAAVQAAAGAGVAVVAPAAARAANAAAVPSAARSTAPAAASDVLAAASPPPPANASAAEDAAIIAAQATAAAEDLASMLRCEQGDPLAPAVEGGAGEWPAVHEPSAMEPEESVSADSLELV
jgi:hypothetical protein